mmetsp:Transcript_61340/g.164749  ORF Transcript_61340/g.164749 Transcript_61340/m.164749 type:complete len:249 (+) Transcript_61340:124-870(+)
MSIFLALPALILIGAWYWIRRHSLKVEEANRLGIRVVCISDTHGDHEKLTENFPDGDILIHAGDFTRFGNLKDAEKFNEWLGRIKSQRSFQHLIIVNGNHESNAPWQKMAEQILSNAVFLKNCCISLRVSKSTERIPSDMCSGRSVNVQIFGSDFFWPMQTENPYYKLIPTGVDIVVSHGPCKSLVDSGRGCAMLLREVLRAGPRLVVSGHIHEARGAAARGATRFVNAANCGPGGYAISAPATVVDI